MIRPDSRPRLRSRSSPPAKRGGNRAPVKAEAALRVAAPLLQAPVADRPNWTLTRLIGEIKAREGVTISKSRLSKVLRKKNSAGVGRDTP